MQGARNVFRVSLKLGRLTPSGLYQQHLSVRVNVSLLDVPLFQDDLGLAVGL